MSDLTQPGAPAAPGDALLPNEPAAEQPAAMPDPAPAAAAEAAQAEPHPMAAIVDAWFSAHFPNSPVARSTEAWNHLTNALADLKQRLIQEN